MNERIEGLANQAKFMAEETLNKQISKNAELDEFAQKFAELIIRESAEIAKFNVMNISTYADAEFVEDQINKHFGVE